MFIRSRAGIENNHTTNNTEAKADTCVKPIANNTHSHRRKGESTRLPNTNATTTATANITQNRTAGPRTGPFAHKIHRDAGTRITERTFATSSGITTWESATLPVNGSSLFHKI
jgi:hypothetical protein